MPDKEPCRAAGEVGTLMTRTPVTASPETSVREVWRIMSERRFRHMPVVADGGPLLGIVTQRDLLVTARASGRRIDFDDDCPVSELMNANVETVRAECCAAEAARHMLRTKRSCLPVVNEDGALVGILTEADYLRLAARGTPPCTCGGVSSPASQSPSQQARRERRRARPGGARGAPTT